MKVVCSVQRCSRRPWADGVCRTHLVDRADAAFSRMIRDRDGYCRAAVYFAAIPCLGSLQCMHLVPRGYYALRWAPDNASTGCAAHHMYLTEHPIEHGVFCEQLLGVESWDALRARRFDPPMRPDDVLRELKASA